MIKFYLPFGLLIILTSCYSVKKSVERSKPNSEKINWPENYKLEDAQFFVHNEIEIKAKPQTVWEVLIRAEEWPDWYEGASNVSVLSNNSADLNEGAIFSWKTMGQNFDSTTVKEFQPPYRLSWEARKNNIRGYHAWLIIPNGDNCKVVTSEVQFGFLTTMQKVFMPNKLRTLHDIWLEELKNKAENEHTIKNK